MSSSRSDIATQSLCLCVCLSPFFSIFGVFELKKQFQWCFKDVPKKFKMCFKEHKKMFWGSFKGCHTPAIQPCWGDKGSFPVPKLDRYHAQPRGGIRSFYHGEQPMGVIQKRYNVSENCLYKTSLLGDAGPWLKVFHTDLACSFSVSLVTGPFLASGWP